MHLTVNITRFFQMLWDHHKKLDNEMALTKKNFQELSIYYESEVCMVSKQRKHRKTLI